VLASRRQERLARQISDGAHGLDALVTSVNQGYPALRESAGAIWAEVSQPGAASDPLARSRCQRYYYHGGYRGNFTTSLDHAVSLLIWIVTLPIQLVLGCSIFSGSTRVGRRRMRRIASPYRQTGQWRSPTG
jgi:hypothetical protein